ncbi:hypothetical protein B0H19DRAFT_1273895 [Mycena capillaripes]|nr:hypothetical protein B0H19DRAFT_1273895 [Mycena capillaripes]
MTARTLPLPRHMRAVRLACCKDPLDRWLATTEFSGEYQIITALPDDRVFCNIFLRVREGNTGTVCTLFLCAYDPRAGRTDTLRLACFEGSRHAADAPLWVGRLLPNTLLWSCQPRTFAARLVAGMTDIPVCNLYPRSDEMYARRLSWARNAAFGTPAHRILARRWRSIVLGNLKSWTRGKNLREV